LGLGNEPITVVKRELDIFFAYNEKKISVWI